jgi:hypothetical protein
MSDQAITFDTNGRELGDNSPFLVFRLSWVAYLREGVSFLVRLLIMGALSLAFTYFISKVTKTELSKINWPVLLGVAIAIAWTIYSIALTHSVRIFTNDGGVWMHRGVFPWEKGITGVQWRDVGQAGYTQGFASWALRSYHISVSHRFTTGSELIVRNVHLGDKAVIHINGIMAELQGRVMPR